MFFGKCIRTKALLIKTLPLLFLFTLPTHSSVAANDLSTLQKEITTTKKSAAQRDKERKELEELVATLEQQTASATLQSQQTKEALIVETQRSKNLKAQTDTLKKDKVKQQKLLEQQLISAYMSGKNDLVKLLLNQDDLSKVIRANSYYFYLSKARLESLDSLQKTLQQLDSNEAEQAISLAKLKKMHEEQTATEKNLLAQKEQRAKALQELKQDLSYQNARMAQLKDAETQLKKKLKKDSEARQEKELAAAKNKAQKKTQTKAKRADQSHSNIAKQRGKLNWPIKGKVISTFGSQRSSQVKWKGISIAANEGEKVRAVATGRVLFAGYFKGYGMVIALDHGDDYITLYGYNQTLLQKTGDVVFQGDAIALAGSSGGQDKTSLYFEISHKGKAQNPKTWLKKAR